MVPRSTLWQLLGKFGIPPTMLSLIRSLHDGVPEVVRSGDGTLTDNNSVTNGLRQGCTVAPSLFNLYFSAVMTSWRRQCPEAGVTVRYKHGRRLVGDRTAKSRLQEVRVRESQFADDVAIYATSRAAFEKATVQFVDMAAEWGLKVSLEKTKGIVVGKSSDPSEASPVRVANGTIEVVQDFSYLGSTISDDGEVTADVSTRIGKAARAFGCLQWSIFRNHHLSTATKREVYKATVLSVLLNGAETWAIKSHNMRRLSGFHNHCIRTIMGVTRHQQWKEIITSKQLTAACAMEETMEELLQPVAWRRQWRSCCSLWHGGYDGGAAAACGMEETMEELLQKHRLRWLGHVARMNDQRLPKQMLFGEVKKSRPPHGVRR